MPVECPKIGELITAAAAEALNEAGECVHPVVGLEFFPPRTNQGVDNLRERLRRLKVSVPPLFYCCYTKTCLFSRTLTSTAAAIARSADSEPTVHRLYLGRRRQHSRLDAGPDHRS
jgi:5,10-methylenetetrahydrofolate reductase